MSCQSWLRGRTVVFNPVPKVPVKPKRFHIGRILWTAIKRTCMVIGAIFLISAIIGVWAGSRFEKRPAPTLPNEMVLTLHMAGAFPEASGKSQYAALLNLRDELLTLDVVVDTIDRAASDNRVKALAVKASDAGYNISQLQEIRASVERFKKSGKKTIIYSESFGGSGYGLGLYYLASVFDEIWMQPVGVVAIGGVSAEMPFFKDIMDKYGVQAQFFQRKEYKNAMEYLSASGMSAASREEMQGLIENLASQLKGPIKDSRTKIAARFDALSDLGLLTDDVAVKEGLVDRLAGEDEVLDYLDTTYHDAGLISLESYASALNSAQIEKKFLGQGRSVSVAVIHVDGMIVSGSAERGPYGVSNEMAGADDIAEAIHDAGDDKRIKTIVLRINSPGGSPSASETIARAVEWVKKEKKKPVYVSMGTVAASGGYWISAPADRIYAMNSTLTGSIGVVGGKINLEQFWKKFDINWERVSVGANSGMMSMNTPFSESEQRQFEASLDNVYAHFITRVAKGRKLSPDRVEEIAKGHVWTGQQAKGNGLVDKIGSLNDVLDDVAKENGVSSRADLIVVHLPSVDDPFDILFEMLSAQAALPDFLGRLTSSVSAILHSSRLVYDPSVPDVRG
ncbi:MAG TPA: signal peptide peptidase SppA [Alphaproteobacteria bacterium]|nr:signal peptide peptidase SppA [Alphaproteobacteria bacterium]HNS44057.1 signal peptide peptidase SppA [Alphaproteobacteria bacterium]